MTWFVFCYWYEPDAPEDPVGLVRIWSMARHLGLLGDHVTVFPPRYASSRGHRGFTTIAIPLIPWPFLRPISYVIGSFLAGLWVARKRLCTLAHSGGEDPRESHRCQGLHVG